MRAKCTPPGGKAGAEKETMCSQRASSWEAEALGRNPSYGEAQCSQRCCLNSRGANSYTPESGVIIYVTSLLNQGPDTIVVRLVYSKKDIFADQLLFT